MGANFMFLSVLCIAIGFIDSTQSTGCLCYLCNRLCGKNNKVHSIDQSDVDVAFDNCLQFERAANDSNPQNGSQISVLSPKSQMLSEMGRLTDMATKSTVTKRLSFDSVDPADSDMKCFGINLDFMTQNNRTVKRNTYIVLVDIAAYDMTHYLYFIGHYLPLQYPPNARQFQKLFNFFAQFQHGALRVNLRTMRTIIDVDKFDEMREILLDLGNQWRNVREFESLSRLLGCENASITSTNIKRKMSINAHNRKHFWKTDWLRWKRNALQFAGIPPRDKESMTRSLLLLGRNAMDAFRKIIVGYDDYPLDVGASLRQMIKSHKAVHVLLTAFFKKSDVVFSFEVSASLLRTAMLWSDPIKKLHAHLRSLFVTDITKFLITSLGQQAKRKNHVLKLNINPRLIRNGLTLYRMFQVRFNAELFGGSSLWQIHLEVANDYMMYLLKDEEFLETVKFSNIQDKGGILFLLNVLSQFSIVGGYCGYATTDDQVSEWSDSISCLMPLSDVNEDGNLNKHFRIPRKFLSPLNGTDAYDWGILGDLTGMAFTDIDAENSETSLEDDTTVQHKADGITSQDLLHHDMTMQQEDIE
eukprot:85730_1